MTRRQRRDRAGLAAVLLALFVIGTGIGAGAAISPLPALAAGTPFTCNPSLYFQAVGNPTQLYREAYNASGGLTFTPIGSATTLEYNALGYDPVDSFLYASTRNLGGTQGLVQIDATGAQTLLASDTLPGSGFLAATFDPSGDYLATNDGVAGQQFVFSLDVASGTSTDTPMTLNGSPYDTALVDWTYADGYLWGADGTSDIVRVDPTTGDVTVIAQSFMPSGSYGAAWTFGNGDLVFSNNSTGEVYQLAVTNPTSASPTVNGVSTAAGQATSNNDGGSCQGPAVDLGIGKTGPASVPVSSPVSWTLTVTDESGVDDSSGYSVEDPVPAGYTDVATTTSGCSVAGNDVVCVEPEIDAGDTFVVTVTATSPSSGGIYTNTASVIGNEDDPNSSNDSSAVTTDVGFANLTLAKSASTITPQVGADMTFGLTLSSSVTSTGDSGQDVVTDDLPSGVVYVSSSSATGLVSVVGQAVSWTVPDLDPGATASLQMTVEIETPDPLANTATFTQTLPNSTGGTTGTSNTVTLLPMWADVSLTKSVTDPNPGVGTDDTFTLTASNAAGSTSDSSLVTVTDVLPSGLLYVSSSPSNSCTGPCVSVSGQTVTWTVDDLAPGASATLQVVVEVDGTASLDNTATFTQTVPDESGGTTGTSNTVSLTPVYADVTLTKSATTTYPDLGTQDDFTLTASDGGPDPAGEVVVTDPVPAGLGIVSAVASVGVASTSGQTVTWTIPNLAAGDTEILDITVNVNTTTPVTNTATFTQATPDSSGTTTGTSNSVTLNPQWADVSVSKSVTSATPTVGSQDTFTLTASNAADSSAGSGMVIVSDPLPAGLTYVSATPSNSCIGPCVTYSDGTVTWVVDDIFAGDSATLQIVVEVSSSAPSANTATFTQSNPSDTGGTTGSSNTVVITPAFADVTVQKSVSSPTPAVGGPDSFTLTVANDAESTSDSGEVVVSDDVPAALAVASASAGDGTVVVNGQTVTWTLADLSPGATASLQIAVTVDATAPVTNTATFTQTTPDGVGGTTGTSNSVTVTPGYAVVSLTKSASSTSPPVGTEVTFTLTATNAGPDAAGRVVVTDVLVAGLAYDSSSPSTGTASDSRQTITWTIPDLTASGGGATATLQIVATVHTTATVTNVAGFTQTTPNATGGTTGSSNSVSLTPAYAAVSVEKVATSLHPALGSDDTFILTASDAGRDAAGKVVVSDALAKGLTYESSSTSVGSVLVSGRTITWTIPNLTASGAESSASLRLVVQVDTTSPVTNTATFTQTTPDATGGKTGTSNTLEIAAAYAKLSLTKTIADPSPHVGSEGTYTIKVTDDGPDTAAEVVVTDRLPPGSRYVSAATSRGAVSEKTVSHRETLTWRLGSLPVGSSASLSLVVRFTAAGRVVNVATATDSTFDRAGKRAKASAAATVEAPVVVPPAHTGEPWSGWAYWLLVSLLGAVGLAAIEGARRRRSPRAIR